MITHAPVGSKMWLQKVMSATVAVKASRQVEWMTDVGVGLKGETAEERP